MRVFSLALIVLLIPVLVTTGFAINYNSYSTQKISQLTIYSQLQYDLKQVSGNKTNLYSVDYNVKGYQGASVNVSVIINKLSITKPNNATLPISSGNYTVNLLDELLNLHYPYFLPYLMFNQTYGIYLKDATYVVYFAGNSTFKLMNQNISAYKFYLLSNTSSNASQYVVLPNGILANATFTGANYTYVFTLKNYTDPIVLNINSTDLGDGVSKPYLYVYSIYNQAYQTLTPDAYLEIYYPFQIGDYMAELYYLLYPQSGSALVQNVLLGNNVNFQVYFKPYNQDIITFLPSVGGNQITWSGQKLTLANTTDLKLVNGSVVKAYLYKYSDNFSTVYIYFSMNGVLLQQMNYSYTYKTYINELSFLGNNYYPLNTTLPTLTKPSYTTLPYQAVDFNTFLIGTIIFTVVLSILIIVFRQKT
ncbi:hypothetical protein SUSAZ_00775 [Sulfolobus acidocaldarius SUSAZ]|nr:hypothetical protein SUSAZ_00775 [Sulfolobus acidocaldarius SUSAZ]